ncbi:MAG: hypothetical protein HY903_03495 [Deltaproteobacteria bacterium]|nr:hypothetical protein [Deltaproteobacteria bacterium]
MPLTTDPIAPTTATAALGSGQQVTPPADTTSAKAGTGFSAVDGKSPVAAPGIDAAPATVAAVAEMRRLLKGGQLKKYYQAAIGANPDTALQAKATELFKSLPKLNADATVDQMLAFGIWANPPKGIKELLQTPRYMPGRQLLCPAPVHSNVFEPTSFLSYKEGGTLAITYRAELVGEQGDKFLVKIDGKDDPIAVAKTEIFKLNNPQQFAGDKPQGVGKTIDYDDPFMKAKIIEAALRMEDVVGGLDFTPKSATDKGPSLLARFFAGAKGKASDKEISDIQRRCTDIVHNTINMAYNGDKSGDDVERSYGNDAGRLAVKGWGVCYDQAGVMAAMLLPFRNLIGFDVQFISGGIYRDVKSATANPFGSGGHGWLQLTYRPNMEIRICDRTWGQPSIKCDRAYSYDGDRYPAQAYWGLTVADVTPADVDMSGAVRVQKGTREFGQKGVDDRAAGHQSLHGQNRGGVDT